MPEQYRIVIPRRVLKLIETFDKQENNRIAAAIDALMAEPRPSGCIKIRASGDVWRMRVGDYRIGYQIDDEVKVITIVRVGHRSEFYR